MKQSKDELLAHFREQLGFLKSSSQAYDAGVIAEAKRLALALRVLLHDTGNSHSLLGQLGLKDSMQYAHVFGVGIVNLGPLFFCGVEMGVADNGEYRYFANLGQPQGFTGFDEWWNGLVLVNKNEGVRHTRADVVLAVANQDGGGHVDPKLREPYASLSRANSMGWRKGDTEQNPFENGPELQLVRTVAHELGISLAGCEDI
jgi:hypothetical protein